MIKGVNIFERPLFEDDRGYFISLTKEELKANLQGEICLVNQSLSQRGVLRGLHHQINGLEQGKLISCIQGSVLDLIVDNRPDSETYGEVMNILLNKSNKYVYVPRGCLHGFISLEDGSIFNYYVDNIYSPENERTVSWKTIKDKLDWPLLNEYSIFAETDFKISKKDNI